jgi:hypothetical protein
MAIEGANSGRIYRYISSSVSGAPVSQIQAFIPISGAFSGASSASSQSMFSYNESDITGDLNTGYVNFPASANTETFAAGMGYSIFIRGNVAPVSTAGSALYELRGPIFSGNQSLPVSFTSSGTVANDGWNLVGNPYPSTIDWDAAGWTRTNVNNAVYMRDNGQISPVYASYIAGVGVNGASRYISSGQAFFVKSDGGTPVLTATESVKSAGTQTTFFRESTIPNVVRITLRQGNVRDESIIRFTSNATASFDYQWDAYKLKNAIFNLSSLTSDSKQLAINSMPSIACSSTIKLNVSNAPIGTYFLDFTEFDSFEDNSLKISLFDSYTKQTIDVKKNNSYSFQVTSDSTSLGSNRFVLTFGEKVSTITVQDNARCGMGSVTLKAEGAPEGNYKWYESLTGGVAIQGANSSTFNTPSLDKTKTYYVASVNSVGCEVSRQPIVATVTKLDPVVITYDGKFLQSNYNSGNQWFLDGIPIPGATDKSIEASHSGVYKVEVRSVNCLASGEFLVTGIDDSQLMGGHISVFPNPTEDMFTIEMLRSLNGDVKILTSMGAEVGSVSLVEKDDLLRGEFYFTNQAPGIYFVQVSDGTKVYTKKVIRK